MAGKTAKMRRMRKPCWLKRFFAICLFVAADDSGIARAVKPHFPYGPITRVGHAIPQKDIARAKIDTILGATDT
jgi:hypothetical protein